jgi:hypothetical protein
MFFCVRRYSLLVNQEGIRLTFLADSRARTMTRMHNCFVRKLHQFASQRIHDLLHGTSPQVDAPNAPGKQRVTCKELRPSRGDLPRVRRQIKRDASRAMARRVHHVSRQRSPLQRVAVRKKLIDFSHLRRRHAQERRLHIHALIERHVISVHHDRRAGILMQLAQAADVVDVRVRADDHLYDQLVTAEKVQDAIDFVAGVDHQRFARGRIADDRAIALQHPHGNGDVDQSIDGCIDSSPPFAHERQYIIGDERIRVTRYMTCAALW